MTSQASHSAPTTQDDEARDTVWKILDDAFLHDEDTRRVVQLVPRPMGTQQTADDHLWSFAAGRHGADIDHRR